MVFASSNSASPYCAWLRLCACLNPLIFCLSCATPQALPDPPKLTLESLLSAELPQQESTTAVVPTAQEILSVNDEMRSFLRRYVNPKSSDYSRLRELLTGMMQEGYLSLNYQIERTQSAAETFARKDGNCLSFTNLFVALARQIGLDVHFQLVDIPPRWHSQDTWVVFDKHINTIVPRLRVNGLYTRDYVVDFNIADYLGNYDQRVIRDEQAIALMYSNLGVAQMRQGSHANALALFRAAYDLHPDIPGLWINIAVMHARLGHLNQAEVALHHALKLEKANPAALSNLAALYAARGEPDNTQTVEAWMRFYRDKNPYYYFNLAHRAYREKRFEEAFSLVKQALSIKKDEHQFHYLLALLHQHKGELSEAKDKLKLALKHSIQQRKIHDAYRQKLEHLIRSGLSNSEQDDKAQPF